MRPYQGARWLRAIQSLLPAILALAASGGALAQTSLATTTHTVVGQGQPPAVEHTFTITNAGSYTLTLTDLGAKLSSPLTPAPLASVAMALTAGAGLVGTPVTSAGTPIPFTATANASYTVHVVGLPGTQPGSGPIEEDVTDSKGNNVFSSIDTLSLGSQQPSTLGILADSLTVSATGPYNISLTDLAFPVALQAAAMLLVDNTANTSVVLENPPSNSFTDTVNMTAGDAYQIIAYGIEGSGAAGGLFGVSFAPTGGGAAVYAKIVPVGSVALLQTSVSGKAETSFSLAASGAILSLNDLSFPTVPLSQAGAAVVDVTAQALAGPAITATGTQSFTPASASDSYQVYAYAVPDGTAQDGSYAVSVQQGAAFPFLEAQAVSSSAAIQPFSFDTSASTAGSYVFTLTDFKFPATLTADSLIAVQNGQLVKAISAAGNFTATLAQGPVTLLAFGEASSSGGLMGLDLSPSGGGAAVFDVTEGIGTGFSATSFTATSAQSVQANVADLKFPTALANLDLAVTSGTSMVGSISSAGSSGSFPFQTTSNTTYTVNVLAQPATQQNSQQEAGTYAMSVAAAPTVTLTPSATSVTSGGTVTLTWTSQNATGCTASASPSNSAWSGSESASGGPVTTSAITADTTFTLTCTGPGGTGSDTATVNVTAAASGGSGHSGGGAIDPELLIALAAVLAFRVSSRRLAASRARSGRP